MSGLLVSHFCLAAAAARAGAGVGAGADAGASAGASAGAGAGAALVLAAACAGYNKLDCVTVSRRDSGGGLNMCVSSSSCS